MNKIFILVSGVILGLVALVIIAGYPQMRFCTQKQNVVIPAVDTSVATDVKNIPYIIGGESFALVNGRAEKEITPDSQSKNVVMMFGEPVYGDLDADGVNDAAVLLVHEPGGSGSFFYAALAINTGDGYRVTNAMFLGDRIAPQTVEIHDGRAVYNYAMRRADEPMTAQPSMGKSTWVHFNKNDWQIGEWVKDFEGESAVALTEAEARSIAEKTCIKGGETLKAGTHNRYTQTWWFDANLNAVREGCNPACVVDEKTETAEINWRCTGLLSP